MLKNVGSNVFSTVVNIVTPLIILPILTRQMPLEMYGSYVTITSFCILLNIFTDFGLNMFLAKEVSFFRERKEVVSKLLSGFVWFKFFIAPIPLIALYFYLEGFNSVFFIAYLFYFFSSFDLSPFYNGLEEYPFLAKITLAAKLLMIISVLLIDFSQNGIVKIIAVQVVNVLLINGFLLVFVLKKYGCCLTSFKLSDLLLLKGGGEYYFPRLGVNLYQQASTFLVSIFLIPDSVAIYSICRQLFSLGQAFIGAVSRVLYTAAAYSYNVNMILKYSIISFLIYMLLGVVVVLVGDDILRMIFNFDISELSYNSKVIYFGLAFSIVSSYWGYPALLTINKVKYAHYGIMVNGFVYVILFLISSSFHCFTLTFFVFLIVVSEFAGMIFRIFYVYRFRMLFKWTL